MDDEKCPDCDGAMLFDPGVGNGNCSVCHGDGSDPTVIGQLAEGLGGSPTSCFNCGGSGACPTCGGSGIL